MIGGHHVHAAAQQFGPERFLVVHRTERRRTFCHGAQSLDVLVGEEQVVGARLNRHVHAASPRLGRHCDATSATDMHDVEPRAGLAGKEERSVYRFELRDDRPRLEEGACSAVGRPLSELARQLLVLGVHGDRQPKPCGFAQTFNEREIVGARKLRKARVRHERLEANDAPRGQFGHFANVARHESAPQRKVGDRRCLERRELLVEGPRGHRARRRIERHVEEQGTASGGKGAASSRASFPVRTTRLVEVQVNVDHAGQDEQACTIDLFPCGRDVVSDLDDAASLNRQVGEAAACWGDERSTANSHVNHVDDDRLARAGAVRQSLRGTAGQPRAPRSRPLR
jgi:hypothetical protein